MALEIAACIIVVLLIAAGFQLNRLERQNNALGASLNKLIASFGDLRRETRGGIDDLHRGVGKIKDDTADIRNFTDNQ